MSQLEKMINIQKRCEQIMEVPEENLASIEEMVTQMPSMGQGLRKIQALALCEVFKGTLPSYRLNEETLQEKLKQVISKDER